MNGGLSQQSRGQESLKRLADPVSDDVMRGVLRNWLRKRSKAKNFGLRFTQKIPALDGECSRQACRIAHELFWSAAIWKHELEALKEEINLASMMYFDKGKVGRKKPSRGSKGNKLRPALLERDGTACWFCGEEMPRDDRTIEHLQPRSKDGPDTLENTVLCHSLCNNRLGDRPLQEKRQMRERMLNSFEGKANA